MVVKILKDAFPEVSKDPGFIKDIINEEETQFLKTLERGRKLLERTIKKLGSSKVIPGDVAWRLYDTYGFPVDLTSLMAEEKNLTIDFEEFELAKKAAQEKSRGENVDKDTSYRLDVHALESLKSKKVPPTDDSFKFNYVADQDPFSKYEFKPCDGKVLAIRYDNEFKNEVSLLIDF